MKQRTIWTIAIIMGLSFMGLLFLQLSYIQEMAEMKKEQFDESVNRALYQASRNLELNETLRYLEKDVKETERRSFVQDSVGTRSGQPNDGTIQQSHQYSTIGKDGTIYSSFELKTISTKPSAMPKGMILKTDKNSISEASKSLQEIIKNRYVYQKALLDEVVYSILYSASDKPLKERINFKLLDQDLKAELMNNGINIPYHFTVSTQDGREVYRCPDYSDEGEEFTYSQVLFRNDPQSKMGVVKIHFPDMNAYIFSSVRFMIPSIIFTLVLLVTFIFTIVIIFRSKRYSEIKNDFINNMTHEFKTPIATMSLVLDSVKSPMVLSDPDKVLHYVHILKQENKRMLAQVENILQISRLEKSTMQLEREPLDVHEVITTAMLHVQTILDERGGVIHTHFLAGNSDVSANESHLTNVFVNIIENAIKYSPNAPVIDIHTENIKNKLFICIKDQGQGMTKQAMKHIFDKFYRAHTGNLHNVKGHGLGLAYVKSIVEYHGGTIMVESEKDKGSTFFIKLPVI